MATEHKDVRTQILAIPAEQRRFGFRARVGHEQGAEWAAVDPRDHALVVRRSAGCSRGGMKKSDRGIVAQRGSFRRKNEMLPFVLSAQHLVKGAPRRGAVAQGRVHDRRGLKNLRNFQGATGVLGVAMGENEGVEFPHAFGPHGRLDHGGEITRAARIEKPRVLTCEQKLRAARAQIEDGDLRGRTQPSRRQREVSAGQSGGPLDEGEENRGNAPVGCVEDGSQRTARHSREHGKHTEGENAEGEGNSDHVGRDGNERQEMEVGGGEGKSAGERGQRDGEGRGQRASCGMLQFAGLTVEPSRDEGIRAEGVRQTPVDGRSEQKKRADDEEGKLESGLEELVGIESEDE